MKSHLRGLIAFSLLLAFFGGVFAAYRYFSKEITFRIAVEHLDSDEAFVLTALSQQMASDKRRIRFTLVSFDKAKTTAGELLQSKKADFAVMRSDDIIPRAYSSVAVISNEPAILMSLNATRISSWKDLKGRDIAVVGRTEVNDVFLKSLLKLNSAEGVKLIKIPPNDLAEALEKKKISGFIFATSLTGGFENARKNTMLRAIKSSYKLIEMTDTETLATVDKRYKEFDIIAGTFRKSPNLPTETVSTLALTRHLVVDDRSPNRFISLVLRDMYDAKRTLIRENPLLNDLTSPDLETGAHVKVHKGAVNYYNNDETAWSDILTENIYMIPILLGGLGTFFVWLYHFINPDKVRHASNMMLDIVSIKQAVRAATTLSELEELKLKLSQLFTHLKQQIDQNNFSDDSAFPLIDGIDQAEDMIEVKRAEL